MKSKIEKPSFLYGSRGRLFNGVYSDSDVTERYNDFLENALNVFLNDFLIKNRQSKLISQPNSNDIAEFVNEYLNKQ